jgi:hypothetical protein
LVFLAFFYNFLGIIQSWEKKKKKKDSIVLGSFQSDMAQQRQNSPVHAPARSVLRKEP